MNRFRRAAITAVAVFTVILGATGAAAPPGFSSGPVADTAFSVGTAISADLTVLPGGPTISDKVRVDARLAISSTASQATSAIVTFTWVPDNRRLRDLKVAVSTIKIPAQGSVVVERSLAASKLLSKGAEASGRIVADVVSIRGTARDTWNLTVVPSDTRSLPIITAAWIEPGAYLDGVYEQSRPAVRQDVIDDVDSMHEVGIDTIVIAYSEYIANGWGAFYDTSLPELLPAATSFDLVDTVLAAASTNGQHVYVGLGRGTDVYLAYLGLDDPARIATGLDYTQRLADDLWTKYRGHDSFYGWYVTHETADIAAASALFDPMSTYLKTLTPGKPVLLAPSGTPVASQSVIAASAVDVFAYQDAVGAGYIGPDASCLPTCPSPLGTVTGGYAYTYNPENRMADLSALFASYESWHASTPKAIWSDLESWEMAGPTYSGAFPADSERLIRQISAEAPHVDVISVYAWPGFLSPTGSSLEHGGERARQLYEGYKDYYEAWVASR